MSLLDANNVARYVTLGGERYTVYRTYLQWSDKVPKGFVSQVAVDGRGNLVVVNRGNPVLQVFTKRVNVYVRSTAMFSRTVTAFSSHKMTQCLLSIPIATASTSSTALMNM